MAIMASMTSLIRLARLTNCQAPNGTTAHTTMIRTPTTDTDRAPHSHRRRGRLTVPRQLARGQEAHRDAHNTLTISTHAHRYEPTPARLIFVTVRSALTAAEEVRRRRLGAA